MLVWCCYLSVYLKTFALLKTSKYQVDFDNNWKGMVSEMAEDFLAFFLPDLYQDIDLSQPILCIEEELYNQIQEADKERIVDKLVRVHLKNGKKKLVLVHIEFQTSSESNFSERMYQYYHLIRSKFKESVTAIAIYTGKQKPRLYNHYIEEDYGTSLVYRFNTYRVIKQIEQELLDNPNPFALFVLANYYVLHTKAEQTERLSFKEKLFELAQQRGYSHQKTSNLLLFIYDLMTLSDSLKKLFNNYLLQTKLQSGMFEKHKFSQDTIDFVNWQTQVIFGTTIEAETQKAKKEAAEAKAAKAAAEAKAAKAEAEAKTAKAEAEAKVEQECFTIINLYQKIRLSIEDIAAVQNITPEKVRQVLVENSIIKA